MAWRSVMVHFFHRGKSMGLWASPGRKSTTKGDSAVPSPRYLWFSTTSLTPAGSKTSCQCRTADDDAAVCDSTSSSGCVAVSGNGDDLFGVAMAMAYTHTYR